MQIRSGPLDPVSQKKSQPSTFTGFALVSQYAQSKAPGCKRTRWLLGIARQSTGQRNGAEHKSSRSMSHVIPVIGRNYCIRVYMQRTGNKITLYTEHRQPMIQGMRAEATEEAGLNYRKWPWRR